MNNTVNDSPANTGGKVHIVFQEADVEVLKKAQEIDGSLLGDIFQIRDEFAVGPLDNLDTDDGWQARERWWAELIHFSPYPDDLVGSFDDRNTVKEVKSILDNHDNLQCWIWVAQNQHDVCGYYWLVSQLQQYQSRIYIIHLHNLPFINEKGQLFYPTAVHEISPKELVKAKKILRKITPAEFEIEPEEWKRICQDNGMVRLLEGGKKIVTVSVDYYDNDIMKALTHEWQKGNKALQNILSIMPVKTGDVFLLWRMKHLAEEGKVEFNGDRAKGWKEFEVKLKNIVNENVDT